MSDKYKELIKKYPELFGLEAAATPYSERGVECGEGWYDLLDHLCMQIQSYVDQTEGAEQVLVEQIKSKFGTLRFYISGYDDYIRGLITMAESISATICEECGEKGILQRRSWMKTLCHECYHAREETGQNKWDTWKNVKAARAKQDEDEGDLYKTFGGD